ncbi:choline/carnitine O-acyltransferase [Pseudonocardia tropica]|uniref:Choline/carnitine O-acyltransferase n=1 Tax=Pseudonocardia tropica TaxID=681289 RepID=A0ABV1JXR9_9PSEU
MTQTGLPERTYGNEDSLPRVPLPTLEQSAQRFLEWCAPLLDRGQQRATEAATGELLAPNSAARTLQAALERYESAEGVHSWLDFFWAHRYLGRRDRIAVNANFFFQFHPSTADQATRAAELTVAALEHKAQLDAETFPPVVTRRIPQSMIQSKRLFSTTRIPGVPLDSVRGPFTPDWPGPSDARHVIVLCRRRMYRMDVVGPGGVPHTVDEVAEGMRFVLAAADAATPVQNGIGSLTTMARPDWARTRTALTSLDPSNKTALDEIERALFVVCLDQDTPTDDTGICRALLGGDSGNRWFDKALSFIVLADGTAGLNIEHCELDGTTILTFIDALCEPPAEPQARSQGTPVVSALRFTLDSDLRDAVASAGTAFDLYLAETATLPVVIESFGADHAKAVGCSPDAFVQLAFQLAHARAKGHVGATYESIATRMFHHGRTEAMRVVTPEVVAFVAAMDDPEMPDDTRRTAFFAAAEAHSRRARQCQSGRAPEQHLWALQMLQETSGVELHATEPIELYSTPGWEIMRNDYLSTSSMPSTRVRHFGFGSTSTQCIGLAYTLLADQLRLHLSTPASAARPMEAFARELEVVLAELRQLLGPGEQATHTSDPAHRS